MIPCHLLSLQERVHAYLLGEGDAAAVRDAIVDGGRVGADERLRIYHDAYRLRLVEALSKAYPNLGKLLGEPTFEHTARSYVAVHPSGHRNLRWYGGELADHLSRTLPQHPIAAELARFEWSLAMAFDSADAPASVRTGTRRRPERRRHLAGPGSGPRAAAGDGHVVQLADLAQGARNLLPLPAGG